jgi:hypothetical protein
MDKEKFTKLGSDWKKFNQTYDNHLIELIDTPELCTPDKLEALKKMQQDVFNLEAELFKTLQE